MTPTDPATASESTAEELAALDRLYADFAAAHMTPLWTQRAGLMPQTPQPSAVPILWRWSTLYPLAARSGDLVPVGRGGERRAIALANPGLPGTAYATGCSRRRPGLLLLLDDLRGRGISVPELTGSTQAALGELLRH